jgi:signal peptidase
MSIAVENRVRGGGSKHHIGPRLIQAVTVIVVVLAGLAVWNIVAPTTMGGKTSYVVTSGSSMLPGYRPGALVITRAREEYEVGDVVAYFNGRVNAVILHRIVALEGSQFTFQGDNNDFVDPYRPAQSELIGESVVYVPKVGQMIARLQDPATFGVVMGMIALLTVGGRRRSPRRSGRRSR